ncbi:MAG: tyrosine-type recombinase/integrase [candidate division Zixibacteria bacterium]
MASIYNRKGIWYITYQYQGRQYRLSTGTPKYKLAELKLKELELEIFRGNHNPGPKKVKETDLPNFFRRYAEFASATKSASTNLSEQYRIRQIREYFARRSLTKIDQITLGELQLFQSFILSSRSGRTYNNFFGLLRAMMNKAVEWGLVDANPLKNAKPLKVPKKVRYFSNEEIVRLREVADANLRLVIDIAVYAGLRRAEIYYLRWMDINLKQKAIHIRAHGEFVPKGKKPGTVPISSKLLGIIEKVYPTRKNFNYDQHIFPRKHRGKPLNPTQVLSSRFRRNAKKAGVKNARLHDCRHTFASHLVQAGVPLLVIKELMRHSDIQSTMIYAHLTPDLQRQAVEKLTY